MSSRRQHPCHHAWKRYLAGPTHMRTHQPGADAPARVNTAGKACMRGGRKAQSRPLHAGGPGRTHGATRQARTRARPARETPAVRHAAAPGSRGTAQGASARDCAGAGHRPGQLAPMHWLVYVGWPALGGSPRFFLFLQRFSAQPHGSSQVQGPKDRFSPGFLLHRLRQLPLHGDHGTGRVTGDSSEQNSQ
jgi:hypothetical protein